MAEITVENPQADEQFTFKMERLAWGVVLMFFALFCVGCAVGLILLHQFLFESTVPLEVQLLVGRGTAVVNLSDLSERAVLDRFELANRNSVIHTDPQSQVTLAFRVPVDGSDEVTGDPVAFVTLKGRSTINYREASAPRFDWSTTGFQIALDEFDGEMNVVIVDEAGTDVSMWVNTDNGNLAKFTSPGHYQLRSTPTGMQLVNRDGSAVLIENGDTENPFDVPENMQAIYSVESEEFDINPLSQNIVENSLFIGSRITRDATGQLINTGFPSEWECQNFQDDLPRGVFDAQIYDGRSVIHLQRGNNASAHGETHCKQVFGEDGYDLTGFTSLELSVTFLINQQSLDQCGTQGSECPLMLLLQFEDADGNEHSWYRGFYDVGRPHPDYPVICESCAQEHQQINDKVWYTFETGNFFDFFAPESRPKVIKSIEFYSSGHEYDLLVDELSIYVDQEAATDLTEEDAASS